MSFLDYVIVGVVAALFLLALIIYRKKPHCSCGNSCSACDGNSCSTNACASARTDCGNSCNGNARTDYCNSCCDACGMNNDD